MTDRSQLSGDWMLVGEDTSSGRLELQALGTPVPPRRGGYRRIELAPDGQAFAKQPGPSDRLEVAKGGHGDWSVDEDGNLTIHASGWEGRYKVEEASKDRLVILKE